MMFKKCHSCFEELACTNFCKDSSRKDNLADNCRACKKIYYLENKQYWKIYDAAPERKLKRKNYKIKNKNRFKEYSATYIKSYIKKRRAKDISFRLANNLRTRLRQSIKNNWKTGSAVEDLGCSIVEFKIYLESKFLPEMTWNNYGRNGWHIDHIVPLSSFDLPNREELLKAVHYTNLQPLWAKDNLIKYNN